MDFPNDIKYTKDHEWIKLNGDIAIIGITDFAQSELGDIVFVELPMTNESFQKGDSFGIVEAVKTVSDLYMPISGIITKINNNLEDNPELINTDPYNCGWIIKIKINNKNDYEKLMDCDEYKGIIS